MACSPTRRVGPGLCVHKVRSRGPGATRRTQLHRSHPAATCSQAHTVESDVAVVGGGIIGLWVALQVATSLTPFCSCGATLLCSSTMRLKCTCSGVPDVPDTLASCSCCTIQNSLLSPYLSVSYPVQEPLGQVCPSVISAVHGMSICLRGCT